MVYEELLFSFTEMSREILGSNLEGIYLHGSAAMGCFNPEKSDLDLILVVESDVPDSVKLAFMKEVIRFNAKAPAKGIELSVVKREHCKPFVYPTPYELHFSVTHLNWFRQSPEDYIKKMKGTDKDLAAHFANICQYGIVLFGKEIQEVFSSVPRDDFIDSIWYDVAEAESDILINPVYVILNLCRALAYMREGRILSKKAGGEWGLRILPPRFHTLIGKALECYMTSDQMKAVPGTAPDFAVYMLSEIRPYTSNHKV